MSKCKFFEVLVQTSPAGNYQGQTFEDEVPICHNPDVDSRYCQFEDNQKECEYYEEEKRVATREEIMDIFGGK